MADEALIEKIGLRGYTYYRPDRSLYERIWTPVHTVSGEGVRGGR